MKFEYQHMSRMNTWPDCNQAFDFRLSSVWPTSGLKDGSLGRRLVSTRRTLSAHRAVVTQREMKRIMNDCKISGYWNRTKEESKSKPEEGKKK
jgi:hypothetical protein